MYTKPVNSASGSESQISGTVKKDSTKNHTAKPACLYELDGEMSKAKTISDIICFNYLRQILLSNKVMQHTYEVCRKP